MELDKYSGRYHSRYGHLNVEKEESERDKNELECRSGWDGPHQLKRAC